jgi:uncharacterized protein YqcC (DUF446 family)
MQPTNLQKRVLESAAQIEAEMRRIGLWSDRPPSPEQMAFKEAFAMDIMPFASWLQFIFLPRVHEAAAANKFPSKSSVGAQAVREFDTVTNTEGLVSLLSEFDALFG